jgi:prepilin-type N-terminal cleavage/methylation domain-containing protein
MNSSCHLRNGFTLIELLAVLLVCAIILSIMIPALSASHHPIVGAPVERNWKQFPAVAQIKEAPTINAIGDIHGDYDKAVKTLIAAGVLKAPPVKPQDAKWAGGSTVLVCTGDMIDKGDRSVDVVRLMRSLQADAQTSNGRVVITLGNHEAEFLASGGKGPKTEEFSGELHAQGIDPSAVAAGTDAEGLGQWMRNLPAAAKVDDWFFSHAGNTHGQTIDQLESGIEQGVTKDGFMTPMLVDDDSILEARMKSPAWWDLHPPTGLERLHGNVAALGVNHLVLGHQPGPVKFPDNVSRAKDQMFNFQNLMFLIDVGMSNGADDHEGSVLKIETGPHPSAKSVTEKGNQTELWDPK